MKMQDFLSEKVALRIAEQLCDQYVASGALLHLHLMLSIDGDIVIDHVAGKARADGTPLASDMLYRIASMSKPLTIAAALILIEQGALALDTPVSEILPEFRRLPLWTGEVADDGSLPAVPCEGTMTVLDLMRHMAGFTYSIHHADALDQAYAARCLDTFQQRRSRDDYIAALAELPLLHPPGERFCYSVSIDVLGVLLERVTGQGIEEILRERLFDPLGMTDSFFVVPPDRLDRLTDAWMMDEGGSEPVLYDRGAHSRWRMRPGTASAGGGLVSSARDYHRFLQMMMHGGELDGIRVLSPESVALMMRNHLPGNADLAAVDARPLPEAPLEGVGMGLGAAVLLDPPRAGLAGPPGLWFWGGLLSTGFFLDPERRMIGLVMTQLMPSGMTQVREDFRAALYDAIGCLNDG